MKLKRSLEIPNELLKDYLLDKIDISNAVVRSKETGEIIKYIKLNKNDELDDAKEISQSLVGKNFLLGLGITAVVAAIGGIIGLVINKNNKVKIPKCIKEFEKNFHKYLNEAQNGELNVKTIDQLLNSLNKVEQLEDKDVKIDFSTKELRFILNKIYDFTNNINIDQNDSKCKFKAPSRNSSKNIVYLKDYLQYQKQVAEKAS